MTAREAFRITLCATAVVASSSLACNKSSAPGAPAATTAPPAVPKPKAPEPANHVLKVGDTANTQDYELTVLTTKQCRNKYYFSETKKGDIWLGVEVTIAAPRNRTLYADPGSGKVIDDNGIVHKATFQVTKDCNPTLGDTKLGKGEKATGWIVFDVPQAAKNLKFVYGDAETATFRLDR